MNAISSFANAPAPSLARIYLTEARYELVRLLRTPAFSVPTLLFPVVFYSLFGIVLPGSYGSLDKATYLLATFGVFGVIGPALFGFGVGMAIEREQGWLELKRVSPMPPGAYFFAKIATGLLFALAVLLLLSAVGFAFGHVQLGLGDWLLLLATLLLGTLPFSALGLFVGALVRGQAAVAVVNLVYLPMAVLSGLWIPLFAFPAIMQKLAVVWPAWHLARLALGVAGQGSTEGALVHVLVLLAYALLFLSLAARLLRR